MSPLIFRIAIPAPVFRSFDYRAPVPLDQAVRPGMRIRVPFAGRHCVGVLLAITDATEVPAAKLKMAHAVLDVEALITPDIMALAHWAAEYYHYPIGEVLASVLPPALRTSKKPLERPSAWVFTALGRAALASDLKRAPTQLAVFHALRSCGDQPVTDETLEALLVSVDRRALRALVARGWIEQVEHIEAEVTSATAVSTAPLPSLTVAQEHAVDVLREGYGRFFPCLLDGVTGSGKTEVYLRIIADVVARGEQALVLVPEIGLTPQLVQRFHHRFQVPIAVLHSNLSGDDRASAWLDACQGRSPIILGTRSAVFTPIPRLGVIIVDEEHDSSFKQQEGFRYHGRDVAVKRAKLAGIPIVLGSATPALDTLYNARQAKYHYLNLPSRVGARAPTLELVDIRGHKLRDGLSPNVLLQVTEHLGRDAQVLVFINRRGYAPTLLCHDCGWVAQCQRCDARMTLHQQDQCLRCHHCGAERPIPQHCPECSCRALVPLGQGTERVDDALRQQFSDVEIIRIDRDTTRRRGSLEALFQRLQHGRRQILVGTQLLAKGHHFPNITLVIIINADQGLFSTDFRAGERLAQTIIQVAGRAGRAEQPGHVIIQTHHPEHPLLHRLLRDGYGGFAESALEERHATRFPPFTALVILRAEASHEQAPLRFLDSARRQFMAAEAESTIHVMGPIAAPMRKRAGRYRAQLIFQSQNRAVLQRKLSNWVRALDSLPDARRVRWSLDVDPQDMF